MADVVDTLRSFLETILQTPAYFLTAVGAVAVLILLLVILRIHRIHHQEIFVHQAWGSNWKGR